MSSHEIAKAMEIWTLQSLLNISIIVGLLALGLIIIQGYYNSLKSYLTLRVSVELWNVFTVLLADIFLVIVVIIGFFVLNPDIMADIKVAVPFVPIATILFAVALILRLFYGGHRQNNPNFRRALWLMFWANLINVIGFSLIMEAPGREYLSIHPSPFWTFLKSYFRSNSSPYGLETAQTTFYICFPILLGIFIWGFVRSMSFLKSGKEIEE